MAPSAGVLSANSPTGCSPKYARDGSRLRARRGGPVRGHPLRGRCAVHASWPLLRAVQDADDVDRTAAHGVHDEEGQRGQHELACSLLFPKATTVRKRQKRGRGIVDREYELRSTVW